MNKVALLLVAVAVVAVLSWVGISMFRAEPTSVPAAADKAPISQPQSPAPASAPGEVARAVDDQPPPQPQSAVNEVIPEVSRGALNTISGTIRVSIRVIVAKDGTVLGATADEPGPSRYFARISTEAAKKWTFGPTDSEQQRVMLLRFYFKRAGVTARANSVR